MTQATWTGCGNIVLISIWGGPITTSRELTAVSVASMLNLSS
jgi:hypothetical protein